MSTGFDQKAYIREYQQRVAGRGGGDLAQVRAHLAVLRESGVTLQRIADHTGLSYPSLVMLRNKATRVTKRVAETVLDVRPDIAPDNARVPVERLYVVLDQLEAKGWSRYAIGRALGLEHGPQNDDRKSVSLGRVRACMALLDVDPPSGSIDEADRLADEARRDEQNRRQQESRQNRGLTVRALQDTFDPMEWRTGAACRDRDLTGVFISSDRVNVRRARAICAGCDVRVDCLAWALATPANDDYLGVCGGTTEDERVSLRKVRWVAQKATA